MRLLLLLLAAGCVRTSAESDGAWEPLDGACVPVGDTRELHEAPGGGVVYEVAGGTVLYSRYSDIRQLDLATGDARVILFADATSVFGSVADTLIYYESNGNRESRVFVDVIADRGALSTSRYRRLSPREGHFVAALMSTSAGAYWWTSPSSEVTGEGIEEWRWDPETDTVEPFPMQRDSHTVNDGTSFFYIDLQRQLTVRPMRGGPPTFVELLPEDITERPIPFGVHGPDAFVYMVSRGDAGYQLISRSGGTEVVLVEQRGFMWGISDATFVYFVDTTAPETLWRVPRLGGAVEEVAYGGRNTAIGDLRIDACNLYYQLQTTDGASLYARDITK